MFFGLVLATLLCDAVWFLLYYGWSQDPKPCTELVLQMVVAEPLEVDSWQAASLLHVLYICFMFIYLYIYM